MAGDRCMKIGNRMIGPGHDVYVIAEISANHNQDFDQAIRIIQAAKDAGADAIKLQTYTADTITIDSDQEYFQIKGTLWDRKRLYSLYQEAYTPWEWQPKLMAVARSLGMELFSTPFDSTAVDFLEAMQVPAHKVASFEIIDIPLLRAIARTGKPVIISTGMASLAEIDEAVRTVRAHGGTQVALLKCTSAYPASPDEMNLSTIPNLSDSFDVPVGLSDHTLGVAVPAVAVALGATIVEKHLTLSRAEPGPDSAFSLEPHEFAEMVRTVRTAQRAVGGVRFGPTESEKNSVVFRRSLFVVQDVKAGEKFAPENVRSIRPAHGLHPRYYDQVIGRMATRDIRAGTPLQWDLIG